MNLRYSPRSDDGENSDSIRNRYASQENVNGEQNKLDQYEMDSQIQQNQCGICRQRKPLKKVSQEFMHQKYFDLFNFYFAKPINEILANISSQHVIMFKDYLYFDDENQYLKRPYMLDEVIPRIQLLAEFYENSYKETRPNLNPTSTHRIINKRTQQHNKLFFAKLQQIQQQNQQQNGHGEDGVEAGENENSNSNDDDDDEEEGDEEQKERGRNERNQQRILTSNLSMIYNQSELRSDQEIEELKRQHGNRQGQHHPPPPPHQQQQRRQDLIQIQDNQEMNFIQQLQLRSQIMSYETNSHDIYDPSFSEVNQLLDPNPYLEEKKLNYSDLFHQSEEKKKQPLPPSPSPPPIRDIQNYLNDEMEIFKFTQTENNNPNQNQNSQDNDYRMPIAQRLPTDRNDSFQELSDIQFPESGLLESQIKSDTQIQRFPTEITPKQENITPQKQNTNRKFNEISSPPPRDNTKNSARQSNVYDEEPSKYTKIQPQNNYFRDNQQNYEPQFQQDRDYQNRETNGNGYFEGNYRSKQQLDPLYIQANTEPFAGIQSKPDNFQQKQTLQESLPSQLKQHLKLPIFPKVHEYLDNEGEEEEEQYNNFEYDNQGKYEDFDRNQESHTIDDGYEGVNFIKSQNFDAFDDKNAFSPSQKQKNWTDRPGNFQQGNLILDSSTKGTIVIEKGKIRKMVQKFSPSQIQSERCHNKSNQSLIQQKGKSPDNIPQEQNLDNFFKIYFKQIKAHQQKLSIPQSIMSNAFQKHIDSIQNQQTDFKPKKSGGNVFNEQIIQDKQKSVAFQQEEKFNKKHRDTPTQTSLNGINQSNSNNGDSKIVQKKQSGLNLGPNFSNVINPNNKMSNNNNLGNSKNSLYQQLSPRKQNDIASIYDHQVRQKKKEIKKSPTSISKQSTEATLQFKIASRSQVYYRSLNDCLVSTNHNSQSINTSQSRLDSQGNSLEQLRVLYSNNNIHTNNNSNSNSHAQGAGGHNQTNSTFNKSSIRSPGKKSSPSTQLLTSRNTSQNDLSHFTKRQPLSFRNISHNMQKLANKRQEQVYSNLQNNFTNRSDFNLGSTTSFLGNNNNNNNNNVLNNPKVSVNNSQFNLAQGNMSQNISNETHLQMMNQTHRGNGNELTQSISISPPQRQTAGPGASHFITAANNIYNNNSNGNNHANIHSRNVFNSIPKKVSNIIYNPNSNNISHQQYDFADPKMSVTSNSKHTLTSVSPRSNLLTNQINLKLKSQSPPNNSNLNLKSSIQSKSARGIQQKAKMGQFFTHRNNGKQNSVESLEQLENTQNINYNILSNNMQNQQLHHPNEIQLQSQLHLYQQQQPQPHLQPKKKSEDKNLLFKKKIIELSQACEKNIRNMKQKYHGNDIEQDSYGFHTSRNQANNQRYQLVDENQPGYNTDRIFVDKNQGVNGNSAQNIIREQSQGSMDKVFKKLEKGDQNQISQIFPNYLPEDTIQSVIKMLTKKQNNGQNSQSIKNLLLSQSNSLNQNLDEVNYQEKNQNGKQPYPLQNMIEQTITSQQSNYPNQISLANGNSPIQKILAQKSSLLANCNNNIAPSNIAFNNSKIK